MIRFPDLPQRLMRMHCLQCRPNSLQTLGYLKQEHKLYDICSQYRPLVC